MTTVVVHFLPPALFQNFCMHHSHNHVIAARDINTKPEKKIALVQLATLHAFSNTVHRLILSKTQIAICRFATERASSRAGIAHIFPHSSFLKRFAC